MDAVIISVASGKGGTGKSTVAVYVGAALAAMNKKVVLIELATGLRSVDIIAGASDKAVFDVADVLSGAAAPERAVVESGLYPGLFIMPAPYIGGAIHKKDLQALCQSLRASYDYILLDVATGFGPALAAAAAVSHRLVLVVTADPVALRDARTLVDTSPDLPGHQRLVLNRITPRSVVQDGVLADLDEAIDIVGVQLLGVVPESGAVQKATARGTALPSLSMAGQVYRAIARRITGEDVPLVYQ